MNSEENEMITDGAIKLVESDDWYTIERVEHDNVQEIRPYEDGLGGYLFSSARISDACVEGTQGHMVGIATAIRDRENFAEKRCAVKFEGEFAYFWSPRNSSVLGKVPIAYADALSEDIFKRFGVTE